MSPKRACDPCISRKVNCSGSWPCDTCRDAIKRVSCTYLRPARKRGPKVRRSRQDREQSQVQEQEQEQQCPVSPELEIHPDEPRQQNEGGRGSSAQTSPSQRPSKDVLAPIVRLYQQHSYSVWPVINADALLQRLDDIDPGNMNHEDETFACLVTALCAATMAQLHLAPVSNGQESVDSTAMAQTCLRIRGNCDVHREHLDVYSVLVSFFLHVYHAKINWRTSAMMYIQEAISGARILRLDETSHREGAEIGDSVANQELVFLLLWVSERGYALHLGLSPSCTDPPSLADLGNRPAADIHVQGLLDLVRLFVAFDQTSVHRKSRVGIKSATDLTDAELKLSSLCLKIADCISTRTADCHITRQWMRNILWQEALSLGLLSSSSQTGVMTFAFPAQVGRDLLHSLRYFSDTDLLPLGRDQLLKCFEVANSLADTALLASDWSHSGFELGPRDFLHALYQKLIPFLGQDAVLNSILRTKTAEVLVMAPARLLTMEIGGAATDWPLLWAASEDETQAIEGSE